MERKEAIAKGTALMTCGSEASKRERVGQKYGGEDGGRIDRRRDGHDDDQGGTKRNQRNIAPDRLEALGRCRDVRL
jgi:hypothetical protein